VEFALHAIYHPKLASISIFEQLLTLMFLNNIGPFGFFYVILDIANSCSQQPSAMCSVSVIKQLLATYAHLNSILYAIVHMF